VVELVVELQGALGLPELGPREGRKTQVDHRGVQTVQGVLELESVLGCDVLAFFQDLVEEAFEDLVISVLVGVGEGRALNAWKPQVIEPSVVQAQGLLDVS
jgi:hypothetical protein